jgi:sulfoxide reductase catalytic subunit YedY
MGGFDAGGDRGGSPAAARQSVVPPAVAAADRPGSSARGVAAAKGLRGIPSVQQFITDYPGPDLRVDRGDYLGIPVWARWQHFFSLFFLMFIMRSGVQILADHPRLYWTRHCTPGQDWFRIQKPVPADPLWTAKQDSIGLPRQVGLPGIRHSIGLARWCISG